MPAPHTDELRAKCAEVYRSLTGAYLDLPKHARVDIDILLRFVQQQRAAVWRDDDGEFWSFLRNVLEQGGAIRLDYDAGKYPSYEHYSARLDEAARERADKWCAARAAKEEA